MKLSKTALAVLRKRYLLKNDKGRVIEAPEGMLRRAAREAAKPEKSRKKAEKEFFSMMKSLDFLPNSPALMNAGTKIPQLSACFVLPVEDSIESIFSTLESMALIHQSGGGVGFSFSHLRQEGDIVSTSRGIASGPVSFIKIFDKATEVIKMGGRRRGANMGILSVSHPDILQFVNAKSKGGLDNFNLSVAATDDFMKAAREKKSFSLVNPRTKKAVGRVNASRIFDEIAENAWKSGDPGIVFIDEINRKHPLRERIEATNPCLTKDGWIMTSEGPKQVRELIKKRFAALTNGVAAESKKGFFKTGAKKVCKLKTKEGFELNLTPEHKLLKVRKITRCRILSEWASLSKLRKGDKVLMNNHKNFEWGGDYSEGEGYLIGLLVGDGTIKKDKALLCSWGGKAGPKSIRDSAYKYLSSLAHRKDFMGWTKVKGRDEYRMTSGYLKKIAEKLGLRQGHKAVTAEIEGSSFRFYKGFISGLFDADGCVIGSQKKGVSIRLAQSNIEVLKGVQRMLLRMGVFSKICLNRRKETRKKLPDGKGGLKEYPIKPQHEIAVSNYNILAFYKKVGFKDIEKQNKLKKAISAHKRRVNKERFIAEIDEILHGRKEDVYDAAVPGKNSFDANGFIVHNCGEQPLLAYESCTLGSINLSNMAEGGKILWERLRKTVHLAVNFLDNLIDINKFPLPEIEKVTKSNRKIGLGVMGFAEMLIKLNIRYDSENAVKAAGKVMKFISDEARKKSEELGMKKGSFPNFRKSRLGKRCRAMRNATVTTIAPTGSISIIAGTSSGIEPLFALKYTRQILEGRQFAEENQLWKSGKYSRELFVTAMDVKPEQHVKIQAAFQKYTDNAVSKTVNLPHTASKADVRKIFMLAHKLRCKGITVYRYMSKGEQVLNICPEC